MSLTLIESWKRPSSVRSLWDARRAASKASCAGGPSRECEGKVPEGDYKCHFSEHTIDKKANSLLLLQRTF